MDKVLQQIQRWSTKDYETRSSPSPSQSPNMTIGRSSYAYQQGANDGGHLNHVMRLSSLNCLTIIIKYMRAA